MGNPGVFQGYLHLYPRKPIPICRGTGFDGCGYGFRKNLQVLQPVHGYDSKTSQETSQEQCGCQLTPPCSLARIQRSCRHHWCQAQIMFGVKFTSYLTLALTHIYYKHHPYHLSPSQLTTTLIIQTLKMSGHCQDSP